MQMEEFTWTKFKNWTKNYKPESPQTLLLPPSPQKDTDWSSHVPIGLEGFHGSDSPELLCKATLSQQAFERREYVYFSNQG